MELFILTIQLISYQEVLAFCFIFKNFSMMAYITKTKNKNLLIFNSVNFTIGTGQNR